jgi:N-acetylneuraminic acid mutarotase
MAKVTHTLIAPAVYVGGAFGQGKTNADALYVILDNGKVYCLDFNEEKKEWQEMPDVPGVSI